MSEYRKHRLLVKLFDSLNLPQNPVDVMNELKADGQSVFEPYESMIQGLAQSSHNPERFTSLCQSLKSNGSCNDIGGVLYILSKLRHMNDRKEAFQPVVFDESVVLENLVNEEVNAHSVIEQDRELDEISRKLDMIHDRMGTFEAPIHHQFNQTSQISVRFKKMDHEDSLKSIPTSIQELVIVEDLLYVLMTSEGNHISHDESGFLVDDGLDHSLIPSITPVLELATSRSKLLNFIDQCRQPDSGKILQAFGHSLETLCQDLNHLIVALEKRFLAQGFLLGQLLFHLDPCITQMRLLTDLISGICERQLKGGALISYLESQLSENSGNKKFVSLVERLLISSVEPFLDSLYDWIINGNLDDPLYEFMISHNGVQSSALASFVLNQSNVPWALANLSNKILLCGIYQRIIAKSPEFEAQAADFIRTDLAYNQQTLNRLISNRFNVSNNAMVKVLESGQSISNLLDQLKKIYFIDQTNSMSSFIENCMDELQKPAASADINWLQRQACIFWSQEESLITCRFSGDSLFNQLIGIMSSNGRTSELGGSIFRAIDAFTFNFSIDFPMNLIVSEDSLSKYQIIFRLRLATLQMISRYASKPSNKSRQIPRACELSKCAILNFFKTFERYLAFDVLEPQYRHLICQLGTARGLDRIIMMHSNFLDTCLRQCLLTNPKLVQILSSIFASADQFIAHFDLIGSTQEPALEHLNSIQNQFHKNLRHFLEALQYYSARDSDHHLGSLLAQIDFNSFYMPPTRALGEVNLAGGLAGVA